MSSDLLCNKCKKDISDLLGKKDVLLCNQDFWEECRKATLETLKDKINIDQINEFLKHMPNSNGVLTCINGMPSGTIGACVKLHCPLPCEVRCDPFDQPWYFEEESLLCPGAGKAKSVGVIVIENNNWEAFFRDTAKFFVQCGAYIGGLLQITWFRSNGDPIGQYNGPAIGECFCEWWGSGHWSRK